MFGSLGMPELIVIFVVALVVFGPSKLPELGKSLGEAIRGFKKSISEADKPSIKNSESRKDDQGDSKP
jgi:sec-independent protein translocase protein TatA